MKVKASDKINLSGLPRVQYIISKCIIAPYRRISNNPSVTTVQIGNQIGYIAFILCNLLSIIDLMKEKVVGLRQNQTGLLLKTSLFYLSWTHSCYFENLIQLCLKRYSKREHQHRLVMLHACKREQWCLYSIMYGTMQPVNNIGLSAY